MKLSSFRIMDVPPEHLWPYFFNARMDERYPLPFRLGLPKPIACMIISGDGTPGSMRRCVTTRGNMDQTILVAEPCRHFVYELTTSDYWAQPFIGHVRDDITLEPLETGQTRVTRITHFSGKGVLRPVVTFFMSLGFKQAHRYAYENWHRMALAHAASAPTKVL